MSVLLLLIKLINYEYNIYMLGEFMLHNLSKLRQLSGVTQSELGNMVGVSQQSINKYENHNIEPDIETLKKISDFFEVSVDYLIGHNYNDSVSEDITNYNQNDMISDKILLNNYHKLDEKTKKNIFSLIRDIKKL